MALDVFVGSLTRYYAGAWRNTLDIAARERGTSRRIAPSTGAGAGAPVVVTASALEQKRPADPKQSRAAIVAWRTTLSRSLAGQISAPLDWIESFEAPCYSGRPGWDGFSSVVLWACYAEHPSLRCPETLPEVWDTDPAMLRSSDNGFRSRYSHLVRNVELWLPSGAQVTVGGSDVMGRRVVIGSVTTLRRQLRDLNGATWKATPKAIAKWAGVVPTRGAAGLEARARYAFAILTDLVERADDERLPMKLDY